MMLAVQVVDFVFTSEDLSLLAINFSIYNEVVLFIILLGKISALSITYRIKKHYDKRNSSIALLGHYICYS